MRDITKSKERFVKLCGEIKREGVEDLLKWLESSDFYTAPASRAYHGSWEGGLLEHSLNVYDELTKILSIYPSLTPVDDDSIKISALFHDLCKVNFYKKEKRNRKNELGKWESYDAFAIDERFKYGGHGSKSVFIVQTFMELKPEEAVAINCHMGSWDGNDKVGSAYEQTPFAWALHVADEAATYIEEKQKED